MPRVGRAALLKRKWMKVNTLSPSIFSPIAHIVQYGIPVRRGSIAIDECLIFIGIVNKMEKSREWNPVQLNYLELALPRKLCL